MSLTDINGFKHQYNEVINYSYYNSTLQSGVNFASSGNLVANLTNKKYMQAYLVGGNTNSYSDVNLEISDTGALQVSQGFIPGQEIAAGQMIPIEFSANINSMQPYPINVTPQYNLGPASATDVSATAISGQSLYLNASNQTGSALALKVGSIPLLSAPTSEADAVIIYVSSSGTINGLSIALEDGIKIYANTCNGTIESNSSCSFKLGVTSTVSGSSEITFNINGTPVYSKAVFYSATASGESIANLVDNSLVGTVGLLSNQQSSVINLVFSNIGTADLSDVIFTPHNSSNNTKLEVVSNGCEHRIESQTQCLVQVQLQAGSSAEQGLFYLDIIGKSSSSVYTARSNSINYYVNAVASLIIASPAGSTATLSVLGNNQESAETVFTLQNNGNSSATITNTALSSSQPLPVGLDISANNCNGSTLAPTQSCKITIKYGPMLLESNVNGVVNLGISYTLSGSAATTSTLNGTINYTGLNSDSYLAITDVNTTGFTGTGSNANPYMASGCNSSLMELSISYKNMSTNFVAQNMALNVINGNIPPFLSVNSSKTTCGYGAKPLNLGIGQTCKLVLTANQGAMNSNSSYNLDVIYPSASWTTNAGFIEQDNFIYNGGSTLYADYTQPTLASSISPTSGSSLSRTLSQTLVNAGGCGTLTTNISSMSLFGITQNPTISQGDCTVNSNGSISCNNNSANPSNVINYAIPANLLQPATLFMQFSLQNTGAQVWYNPDILLFQLGN